MSEIIEENKKLIAELNTLMKTELSGFDEDNKAFPYLGWFWRDIAEYEAEGITVSFLDGIWWLDEALKWSYPKKRLTPEESNTALKLWVAIVKNQIEYLKFSGSLRTESTTEQKP